MTARFQSPLCGTAFVIATLMLLAVPLHKLTTVPPPMAGPAESIQEPSADTTCAILRIHSFQKLWNVVLRCGSGKVIWQSPCLAPGECEFEAELPWSDAQIPIHLSAQTEESETVVFLTVMPDGHEEQTLHTIGASELDDELLFEWSHP